MKQINNLLILISLIFITNACTKDKSTPNGSDIDNEPVKKIKLTITLNHPKDINIQQYKATTLTLTEINSGLTTKQEVTTDSLTIELAQGSYEATLEGMIIYTFDGNKMESAITAKKEEIQIIKNTVSESLDITLKSFQKDLIIEEIFFTGSITPEGEQYNGDKYFKIYNNTTQNIYADGLLIAYSSFLTTQKENYEPNIMSTDFTAEGIIKIPGNGSKYLIKPGEHIIIASDAINHKENNPKSFDLTTANFEFYNDFGEDVDNPAVPNVINLFDYMVMHNRGFTSYVIARLPKGITDEQFLSKNKYTYKWIFEFDGIQYDMDGEGCKIPNKYIVDAVNLSVESEFQWIVTAPSLDNSWTYCGKIDFDQSRYGKSVRRKTISEANGHRLLQDTNNSSVDFIPGATPSISK